MQITTLGIDLAKNVFCLHGCDANGRPVLRKNLARRQLLNFVANLPVVCKNVSPSLKRVKFLAILLELPSTRRGRLHYESRVELAEDRG